MRRRDFLALAGGGALEAFRSLAKSQQSSKLPIVGVLTPVSVAVVQPTVDVLRKGLQAGGLSEGTQYLIKLRAADGHYDHLPELAKELQSRRPAAVVLAGTLLGLRGLGFARRARL